MKQNELNFLQEAVVEKIDRMLNSIVDNANAQVEKEKPKTTKKGETK